VKIDEGELDRAAALLAQGERSAARVVLSGVAETVGPLRFEAFARLAALDEEDGRAEDAAARWQAILADDIDHDLAWAALTRLRARPGARDAATVTNVPAPTLDSGMGVNLSRFEITGEIGRGAFATVYRVRDTVLDLPLALKVLHPFRTASEASARGRDQAFFAETRKVAGLRHRGVIAFYDIDDRARTLVMELITGGTLRDRLRAPGPASSRRWAITELARFAERLLRALSHVHTHGIVHGDLSPRNVLLRAPDDPVLIDFGNTRLGDSPDAPAGTPLYLAPEQFQGAPTSPSTDLFGAGTILFEAAFGHPLRTREDLMAGRTTPGPLPHDDGEATDDPALARRVHGLIEALLHAAADERETAAAAALARL
jgi:tRNA A-37 threonylcarbamoyl transferase component Bud32